MFQSLNELNDYTVVIDGMESGVVDSWIIDSQNWMARYMIVRIADADGNPRTVPVPPVLVVSIDMDLKQVGLDVPIDRLISSPFLQTHTTGPLARENEVEILDYFGQPYYWDDVEIPAHGPGDLTGVPLVEMALDRAEQEDPQSAAPIVMHRLDRLAGFDIEARDGDAGELDDLIVNLETWEVQYAVVDLGGFLGVKKVVVSPSLFLSIDAEAEKIEIDLNKESIHESMEYSPELLIGDEAGIPITGNEDVQDDTTSDELKEGPFD